MKTLPKLEDNDCRFPFGEGPFLFCGDEQQAGSSYCSHHHAICWDKPKSNPPKARIYSGTDFAA